MKELEIHARYKGYCAKCHYTVWKGERVWLQGKVRHLDCLAALKDKTPRVLDERYLGIYGDVRKKALRHAIERRETSGAARP